jgi:hypothetical protein
MLMKEYFIIFCFQIVVPWWLSKLVKDLPSEIVLRLVENVLEVQLTSPPFISVHQALARQAEWKDGRKSFDFVSTDYGAANFYERSVATKSYFFSVIPIKWFIHHSIECTRESSK